MSGKKEFVPKKDTLADLPSDEKWRILRYGEKCDPEALAAVHAIHKALFTETFPVDSSKFKAMFRDEAWGIIAKHYRADWAKHDGSFFRAMADAMKVHQQVADPAYARIGIEIQECDRLKLPLPSAREMHRILMDAEIEVTLKTVRRGFTFWGRNPAPMKRGAQAGQKRRQTHRARN